MHRLRDVLQPRRVVSAPPDSTVHAVAVMMGKGRVGAIPIMDGERLVGVFSERDLMTRVVVPRLDVDQTPVSEVMTTEVVTADLEDAVVGCVEKMQRVGCRHLPVRASGRLIGMISMRDLLNDEIQEQDDEIRSLKAYIHQTPI
ncbi:MAG: CBS domain-containing protein [Myxococcota bacterium]|nr:CBS domain-containing protein [Myxococcota bacterium]